MNAEQAKAVAREMERHGYNTMLRLDGGRWVVWAIDCESEEETTIRSAEEWQQRRGTTMPAAAPTEAVAWAQGALL